jgi:mono/diheme cytochrome c family protein
MVLLAAVGSRTAAAGQPGAAAPPAGDPAKGRTAFVEYQCAWCHGTEGQGGLVGVGPRVALVPRSLQSFIGYVRTPTNRMSAYSDASIPDEVLRDIYAYLRSRPPAKPAAEVPLLDQLRAPGRSRP